MSIGLFPEVTQTPNLTYDNPADYGSRDLDCGAPAVPLTSGADDCAMWPVAFNGCFGWLHAGLPGRCGDVAVVICQGLDRDALDSHHGMRLLADAFAAAGYPALRFDYPGLADSCDRTTDETWGTWQQSVHEAADWLRRTTRARRVLFCGLRIGATLAALAADSREDTAGLILLAPVLRSRSYMRQLQVQAQMEAELFSPAAAGTTNSAGGLDFHELRLSAETVALIGQADLRRLRLRRDLPVAVYAQAPSLLLNECVDLWSGAGAAVTSADFAGLEPLLRYNLVEEASPPEFAAIIAWLLQALPPQPGVASGRFPRPAPASLRPEGCRETPLRFGPEGRLFGMLCEPDDPALAARAADRPAVILGNTGRDPHYAFGRFGVELARRLANAGIASLRFDFSGLGDSNGPPGHERMLSHMFELDRGPDFDAAIEAMQQRGYRRFAVEGRCAGAYHAFRAALADRRIETLLLVNLPVFEWRVDDTVDFATRRTARPGPFLAKLAGGEFWGRLVRGEVHVTRFLRAQAVRLGVRARLLGHRALSRFGFRGLATVAQAGMATLAAHGTRTLFIFAPEDSGYDAFELEFGPRGAGVLAFAGAAVDIDPQIDHQLSTRAMRRSAIDKMIAFLAAAD